MSFEEGTAAFGLPGNCAVHGDEYTRECALCSAEYCAKCLPGSKVCEDCIEAEAKGVEHELEDEEELEDVARLDGGEKLDDADEDVLGDKEERR